MQINKVLDKSGLDFWKETALLSKSRFLPIIVYLVAVYILFFILSSVPILGFIFSMLIPYISIFLDYYFSKDIHMFESFDFQRFQKSFTQEKISRTMPFIIILSIAFLVVALVLLALIGFGFYAYSYLLSNSPIMNERPNPIAFFLEAGLGPTVLVCLALILIFFMYLWFYQYTILVASFSLPLAVEYNLSFQQIRKLLIEARSKNFKFISSICIYPFRIALPLSILIAIGLALSLSDNYFFGFGLAGLGFSILLILWALFIVLGTFKVYRSYHLIFKSEENQSH